MSKLTLVVLSIVLAILIVSIATIVIHISRRSIEEGVGETMAIHTVEGSYILLPLPKIRSDVLSVEQALAYRRSIRSYEDKPITIEQLSQLLWATYGITQTRWGFKTTPSAGATYPLEIYVVIAPNGVVLENGSLLTPGSYKYDPYTHSLKLVKKGDLRYDLYRAALNQEWVLKAPINIVICAVYERTTRIYGERGYRYVHMEVGHAGQNIYLEATALGLGTVAVGAFYDDKVHDVIGAKPDEHPLYIMPVGIPKQPYRVTEEEIHRFIEENRRSIAR